MVHTEASNILWLQAAQGRASVQAVTPSGEAIGVYHVAIDEFLSYALAHRKRLVKHAEAVLVDFQRQRAHILGLVRALAGTNMPCYAVCDTNRSTHVEALLAGAHDVLVQPVDLLFVQAKSLVFQRFIQEIVHQVKAVPSTKADTAHQDLASNGEAAIYRAGAVELNQQTRKVRVGNCLIGLAPREFDVLAYLMKHMGRCLTRDELLDRVWGIDFETGTNVLDVHIYELRKKLRSAGVTKLIDTVRGVGYRLESNMEA